MKTFPLVAGFLQILFFLIIKFSKTYTFGLKYLMAIILAQIGTACLPSLAGKI